MHIQGWQEALLKYAIEPMQHFAYVKGKNATDIGMVIEAMDLLYSGAYDGFCLISSDSDFTSLALRIRKNHVKVFGFGKHNTVSAFAQACDNFYYVEDLLPLPPKPKASSSLVVLPTTEHTTKTVTASHENLVTAWDGSRLKCDTKLLKSLRASIINHPKAEAERWVNFGLVGHGMKEHYPDFAPQNHGYAKLADIIKNIDIFEIKAVKSTLYVRDKTNKQAPSATTPSVINTPTRWTTKQLQTQTHLISVLNKLIRENPKSDKGWSNLSYIVSQIRQNHVNIKWDKYGYPKFPEAHTSFTIYSSTKTDVILFCMNTQRETHSVEDTICSNQRYSKDGSILLSRKEANGIAKSNFTCALDKRSKDINQLIFIIISKLNNMAFDRNCPTIEVNISNRQEGMLFSGEFDSQRKAGKKLLLFTLN